MTEATPNQWFRQKAAHYDAWYQTPRGAFIDAVETQLVFDLLPPCSGTLVLDAGCGTGLFTQKLHRVGCQVMGVDISRDMLRLAAQKELPVPWIQADLRALPFASASFDAIYSVCAVEFIQEVDQALDELWRCLKPAGYLIVATIAGDSPWSEYYRERARTHPDSIFRHAHFHSQMDLTAWRPQAVRRIGECLFIPPDAPDDEFTPAVERQGRGQRPAGFTAVVWQKDQVVSDA